MLAKVPTFLQKIVATVQWLHDFQLSGITCIWLHIAKCEEFEQFSIIKKSPPNHQLNSKQEKMETFSCTFWRNKNPTSNSKILITITASLFRKFFCILPHHGLHVKLFCIMSHYALNPIIKAEKIFLNTTHYFHFGQHILVLRK